MKKKNTFIILAILLVLAAAIVLLSWLNARQGLGGEIGSLTISRNGEILRVFTMDEIRAMPYIEQDQEIVSSSHQNERGVFRGVPLRALLEDADPELLQDAVTIVSRAEDAFVMAYSADEVLDSDDIFVAYSKDGNSLGTMEGGGSGPFRIIIIGDPFGNRSTRFLIEIEVR